MRCTYRNLAIQVAHQVDLAAVRLADHLDRTRHVVADASLRAHLVFGVWCSTFGGQVRHCTMGGGGGVEATRACGKGGKLWQATTTLART